MRSNLPLPALGLRVMHAMFAITAMAALLPATSQAAQPAGSHPFSVHDMVAMERLSDPQPSPEGKWVVYTRRTWDEQANKVYNNLWLVSMDGKTTRQLTSAKASDSGARWMPDGRSIVFISTRSGSSQIWTIDVDGGEAVRKSSFPVDVDNLQLSPDGMRYAFSAEVYPDCADLQCTANRDKETADSPVKARIYTKLMIRHWDTWEDGKRSHLFVWSGRTGAEPIDLMKGADADAPTKPFGGPEEYAWSPDGTEIAFTSKMAADDAWSTDLDIYVASTDGHGYRCITEPNEATDTTPAWSPDGKTIAYLAMSRPRFEADRQRVMLYDRAAGTSRALTETWDRSANAVTWAADGRKLFITAEDNAHQKIFSVDAATGVIGVVVGNHYNTGLGITRGGRLVFTQDSLSQPAEVFTCRLDGADMRRLTNVNDARMASVQVMQAEEFWFRGARNDKVHGWIIKPVGYQPGHKYPVAFMIHGGPQGTWNDHFHYRWNAQAYTGAGYAVIQIDFHGSTGYGQGFTDAIRGDWGGKPYEDLMKGLDYALATYDYLDGNRVGALGASYGGYMVNWIAGHTDRFKCLVSHDGEFDERSSYYSTEELWFPEWEFNGTPWEKKVQYEHFSPSEYVTNWKTPMLVIHGALDFRLVETEGMAVFTALQRRGIPSKFLYFPDENHWVLKSKNSILWHDTVIGWLDQYLKK